MNIGIIGARGLIGRRVLAEAVRRGHDVTALTRDPHTTPSDMGVNAASFQWRSANVLDTDSLIEALKGIDVVVSAFGPGRASEGFEAAIAEAIREASSYVAAAKSLIHTLESYPALRLLVVGGMGSLELSPGKQVVDSPDFSAMLSSIGIPADFKLAVLAHREALNLYRTSNRNWTYFSPPGSIAAGERTGRFRIGGDQLLVDAQGHSKISFEDYAVAMLDEIEQPRHIQRRFTAAY
ncbi:NAD(P)-dependent oxidoreductase [Nevskia soli]|uniref:NAD(P)-dependent oxidoreductase n=1 Tax=Nevskia soli TaxID=418856 RepID=UPI0004A6E04B|nr:NAD(P)H-binding protein [Nevskia soli]